MTVRLVIENSPRPQAVNEVNFEGGQLVIGRSDDADWQLTDPDMYVSRRHCVLTFEDGVPMVTDASSGGLFIDNAASPLGAGNSVPLQAGMRLRLGDFVLRVEMGSPESAPEPADSGGFDFGPADEPPPKPTQRPSSLPNPFGVRSERARGAESRAEPPHAPRPLDQEDPFELDLSRAFSDTPRETPRDAARSRTGAGSGPFDFARPSGDKPEPTPPSRARSPFAHDEIKSRASAPGPEPEPELPAAATPTPELPSDAATLRAALFRGLGLDPVKFSPQDAEAEAEAIGARLREMVDGVMLLLRTRAQEKQRARVAQTIIASEDVNPLKFLATTEDALAALIEPRGKGYLPPDKAVSGAFRDLTDHQLRTWTAVQSALRQIIDRFDPAALERELADSSMMERLIAGGRSGMLWQLYEKRYEEIARAAEERFMGEVGADFRDAYENQRRS